jgi:hypothetical protein
MPTPAALLERAQSNPNQEIPILLTLTSKELPEEVSGHVEAITGFEHLFSGTLTGAQIVQLAANPVVLTIEEDSDFHSLEE